VADGLTNRQIADKLFLSERTVETHVTNILNRLGLSSRLRLTRWLTEQKDSPSSALHVVVGRAHQGQVLP
jgi:DNA-binding NarL/FixJ family response regulator